MVLSLSRDGFKFQNIFTILNKKYFVIFVTIDESVLIAYLNYLPIPCFTIFIRILKYFVVLTK